MTDFLFDY